MTTPTTRTLDCARTLLGLARSLSHIARHRAARGLQALARAVDAPGMPTCRPESTMPAWLIRHFFAPAESGPLRADVAAERPAVHAWPREGRLRRRIALGAARAAVALPQTETTRRRDDELHAVRMRIDPSDQRRTLISGRMADVCAALDELVALQQPA